MNYVRSETVRAVGTVQITPPIPFKLELKSDTQTIDPIPVESVIFEFSAAVIPGNPELIAQIPIEREHPRILATPLNSTVTQVDGFVP